MKRIVVGLSGGVDSSVAALILKKQGYDVIGIFMDNWDNSNYDFSCIWKEDSIYAMLVANRLNIPFQIIDMKKEYKKYVLNYMFNEYKNGNTPNPDILCNRKIKFNFFLKIAINNLKANYIATGHYAIKKKIKHNNKTIYKLLIGKDINKDQSYFLCQLNQYQLKKSLFPLGYLTKEKVRNIAKDNGLINALKKDSQGLCFIGKIKLSKFLHTRIPEKKGKIINIDSNSLIYNRKKSFSSSEEKLFYLSRKPKYKVSDGKIIGFHKGAYLYTKGQRKGISIGGLSEAVFVIDTDVNNNIVYTGIGKKHPGLYRKYLFIKKNNIHWIRNNFNLNSINNTINVKCRIRYRQPLQSSILHKFKEGIFIEFKYYQYAITEGQFAVWYIKKELIGSGVIS